MDTDFATLGGTLIWFAVLVALTRILGHTL